MRSRLTRTILATLLILPLSVQAAPNGDSAGNTSSLLPYGLAAIIVVLMAAIALLASVLKQLAFVYRDKFRKERSDSTLVKSIVLLITLGAGSTISFAQATATEEVAAVAESPYISGMLRGDFYFVTGIIFFELFLVLVLLSMIYQMVRILRNIPEKKPIMERIMAMNLMDYFNKSVAVEKEHTIVMDHDYDGIHELDNSLPPWWKWGFIMTIFFAFGYMWYFHIGGGPSQIDEYVAAVTKGEQEKQAYLAMAGNSIDENTVAIIKDAGQLADAKVLYNNTCAACHREDGGGAVGPNLTDDYWMHGGSLKDVFKSVKYGWKDKGMPEWQNNMSAKQIAGITSYVMSMKGKKPVGAKEPQGELFVETVENKVDDTTSVVGDRQISQSGKAEDKKEEAEL